MAKRKVVNERFKSLEAFLEVSENRPPNAVFNDKADQDSAIDESHKRKPWSGTKTYNEAEDVLKTGYREPLEKMKRAILKIGENENKARPRPYNDMVGYAPNVPNYLMNIPVNMINRKRETPKTNTIHLIYSYCAAAKTTTDEMIQGGINFISLVNSLEKQGYRVKIDAIFTSIEAKTVASFQITLKEYGQGINLLKLAFPLVHPAMLRRFAFKWLETTPELKDKNFRWGYGKPLNFVLNHNLKKETEFLKDHGIITGENSYYCNVYEAKNAKSVEDLADRMEITR